MEKCINCLSPGLSLTSISWISINSTDFRIEYIIPNVKSLVSNLEIFFHMAVTEIKQPCYSLRTFLCNFKTYVKELVQLKN